MPKPVLLTVDDDPEVLRAIERDLRSRYADRYRVMRANSGSAGLATLRELKARNNPVALLLADQRMPQMDGVNFLSEAMEMHPLAKRALLTAYADTNAAIDAINEARVHYYLMKPWDPPEEKLFPALDVAVERLRVAVPSITMTGTGAAQFAVFATAHEAEAVLAAVRPLGYPAWVCRPIPAAA